MAFESWYKSILATKLNPWDTTLTVAVPPTITAGRIYLKSWTQEEWMSFSWVDGNVLTGLTRELSTTSIPATYKNLKTTNLSSPFYNFPRQINATTVGADLISQLQAKGWITD